MSETLKCFVPIIPKPQKRHGDHRGGKHDPSKAAKRAFATVCTMMMGMPDEPPTGPVELSLEFVLNKRPKQQWPDLSNLIKLVEDALEGIYYANDRQICRYGNMSREFTQNPDEIGTAIEIIYL